MPGGYRRTGHNANVDESLFGGPNQRDLRKEPRWAVSRKELAELNANMSYISMSELSRIKQSTIIRTEADIAKEEAQKEAARNKKLAKANRRKARMKEKEEEAKRRNAQKSDVEIAEENERRMLLDASAKQRAENNDGIKTLMTLGTRAAAFTVREKQILDKEKREKEEVEYSQRMEAIMELDRLKDLQRREEIEKVKLIERLEGAKMLKVQMRERQQQRLDAAKEVELEGQAMLRQIQKNKEMEEERLKAKAEAAAQARVEVMLENKKAIEAKKLIVARDKLEEDKVIEYQRQKAAREAELEAEEEARKAREEAVFFKLLSQQKRAMDNRSEMDELRAKRYREALDRKVREREKAEHDKRQDTLVTMQKSRVKQQELKRQMLAREARVANREYEVILKKAWEDRQREEREAAAVVKKNADHLAGLKHQIREKTQVRESQLLVKDEELRQMKAEFKQELSQLERCRQEVLDKFRNDGIGEKYLSELVGADMVKFQMR